MRMKMAMLRIRILDFVFIMEMSSPPAMDIQRQYNAKLLGGRMPIFTRNA